MDHVIDVKNVSKKFKAYENKGSGLFSFRRKSYLKRALNGVSLTIDKGETVALLGKNGSGKSTLIKIMCGILFPTSGSVRVLGLDPWEQRISLSRRIGVVLGAHGQLYWDLPAIDTFELMRKVYGIPKSDYQGRLDYYLDLLELRDVYKRQVRTLSLGEQMKCNFVASILHNPELVILDEPTIGVDLPSKQALRTAILESRKENGTTFLLTTHIVEDITMADRILALDKGNVIFDGSKRKLETLFGNKKVVELEFSETPDYDKYVELGKITKVEGNYLRMEADPKVLTSARFTRLLSKGNIIDYRVGEQDLSGILMRLYKVRGAKAPRGEGHG
ncbi:Trehalose/maltose import ATP-binding protein MalK [uncultured archaeon]|nr:Trehalose/maltose import ATP-binding protein MalK [uncultured archaeon]